MSLRKFDKENIISDREIMSMTCPYSYSGQRTELSNCRDGARVGNNYYDCKYYDLRMDCWEEYEELLKLEEYPENATICMLNSKYPNIIKAAKRIIEKRKLKNK